MQPLKGLTVVTLEHAIAAPFATRQLADLGARVIKIERPGSRRLRARLRLARARPGVALRLDQPLQGEPHARRQASRCRQGARAPGAREGRRRRAEPRARRRGAPGSRLRAARGAEAGDHRLRHLRLRRRRPVPRQEGLRPADPERGRLRLGHRHGRRAVQGRPVDRRHRRRHVRVHQHPRRAAAARPDRQAASTSTSRCSSRSPNGPATRCTTRSTARRRRRAPARRTRRSIPMARSRPARWRQRDAGPAERARVGQLLRQGAAAARSSREDPRFSGNAKRVAERTALRELIVETFAAADDAAGGRAAGGARRSPTPASTRCTTSGSIRN